MKEFTFDAVVIGFGKAGKTLSGALAKRGSRVALVEMDAGMYGGTCINVGCIPSKSLYTSAQKLPADAGAAAQDAWFEGAIAEKRRLTGMLRQKNYDKLNTLENVTIIDGKARFTAPLTVNVTAARDQLIAGQSVSAGDELQLTGADVFINTGSTSFLPNIPGIRETPGVYTSTGLMDLDRRPERLVVLGGGYIGLEFSSMFAAYGSQVTVLQDSGVFLPREDTDVAAELRSELEAQGVKFIFNAKTTKIAEGTNGPEVTFAGENGEETLAADAVLIATGRIPNTRDLNCEAAGVKLTPRGAVEVDDFLRTSAPHVWAMGDVNGGLQHTYVSLDDYRVVLSQLTGGTYSRADRKNVPYSVFLKTPYSRVGLNEREAREAGYEIKVNKLPTAAVPKAQVLRAPSGFLKAVIDAKTGRILGAMLICQESYEMINLVKLAIDLGADASVLRDRIYTHPTMTEAFNDLF